MDTIDVRLDSKEWYRDEILSASTEVLDHLARRWDLQEEIAGETVDIGFGYSSHLGEDGFTLPEPEEYVEAMKMHASPDTHRVVESAYPVPYSALVEEAGHWMSNVPARVERKHVDTVEDIAVNELFGGLALQYFDPRFVDSDVRNYRQNLDIVGEMHSDEHVDYVGSIRPEVVEDLFRVAEDLDAEDPGELDDVINNWYGRGKEYFDGVPATSRDFPEYTRNPWRTPKTYSEWFVDDFAFGFRKRLGNAEAENRSDLGSSVEEVRRDVYEMAEHVEGWSREEIEAQRDAHHVHTSVADLGYVIARQLARDLGDPSSGFNYDPASLVHMTNYEIYREFEDYISDRDDVLREAHGVPLENLPIRDPNSVVTGK